MSDLPYLGNLDLLNTQEITLLAGESYNASTHGRREAGRFAVDLGRAGHVIILVASAGCSLAAAQALSAASLPYIWVVTSGLDAVVPPHLEQAHEAADLVLAPEAGSGNTSSRRRMMADALALRFADRMVLIECRFGGPVAEFAWSAVEEGVPLFAVPGPTGPSTAGSNRLIVAGDAQAITSPGMLTRLEVGYDCVDDEVD